MNPNQLSISTQEVMTTKEELRQLANPYDNTSPIYMDNAPHCLIY
jgi:hypothetical protein